MRLGWDVALTQDSFCHKARGTGWADVGTWCGPGARSIFGEGQALSVPQFPFLKAPLAGPVGLTGPSALIGILATFSHQNTVLCTWDTCPPGEPHTWLPICTHLAKEAGDPRASPRCSLHASKEESQTLHSPGLCFLWYDRSWAVHTLKMAAARLVPRLVHPHLPASCMAYGRGTVTNQRVPRRWWASLVQLVPGTPRVS